MPPILLPAPTPWPYIADFTRPEGLQHCLFQQSRAVLMLSVSADTSRYYRADSRICTCNTPPGAVLYWLSYVCVCPRWATSSRGARGPAPHERYDLSALIVDCIVRAACCGGRCEKMKSTAPRYGAGGERHK